MFYTKLKSSTIYRTINHLPFDLKWYFIIFESQTHINVHKDIHISVLVFSIPPYSSVYFCTNITLLDIVDLWGFFFYYVRSSMAS